MGAANSRFTRDTLYGADFLPQEYQVTGANNPSDNLFQEGDFYTNTEKGDNFQNVSNPYDYNRWSVIRNTIFVFHKKICSNINCYLVRRSDDRANNKPKDNLYQYGYIDLDTDYNDEFSQKNPDRDGLFHEMVFFTELQYSNRFLLKIWKNKKCLMF